MIRAYQFSQHGYLLGKSNMRYTTQQEQQVLQRVISNNITEVQEFKKISINSTVYSPMKHVKADCKSDNSLILTYGDTYCSIDCVVRFQTEAGEKCGLFVFEREVTQNVHFNEAKQLNTSVAF